MAPDAPDVASARRDEHQALALRVERGEWPTDLHGHVFFVGPAGHPGSDGFRPGGSETVLSGDGLVHRVDLAAAPTLTSRLVAGPDLHVDAALEREGRARARFRDVGMFRMSAEWGARNTANTGLVPFTRHGRTRLLATYDGGIPLEVDPTTLRVRSTVGSPDDWRGLSLTHTPFPPTLSAAHPGVDSHTGELFFVNYGRGLAGLLGAAHWLSGPVAARLNRAAEASSAMLLPGATPRDFTYLLHARDDRELVRHRLVRADGRPLRISQTVHQVCVTAHHVLILDTSMKVAPVQGLPSLPAAAGPLDRRLRRGLSRPPRPDVPVHIVRRAHLERPAGDVVARSLRLPLEAFHAWPNYADSPGELTLHVAHACALDVAEWLRTTDLNHYTSRPVDPRFVGIPTVAALDVSRVARYRIDPTRGIIMDRKVTHDEDVSWGITLSTGPGLDTPAPPGAELERMFHISAGLAPELVTRHVHQAFESHPSRLVPISQVDALARAGGLPSALFSVDLRELRIDDAYRLPREAIAGSIQYVPSRESKERGYLVCTVIDRGRRELQVFDARHLSRGPLCRAHHPDWRFGATLHAAWLQNLPASAPPSAADWLDVFAARARTIAGGSALFDDHVRPHFT